MRPILSWLVDNMLVVRFVYGLSFFSLGLTISLQYRSHSRYRLAGGLWALAAFAFLHAFADWGLVFIPLQGQSHHPQVTAVFWGFKTILGAVSFGFLLHFGIGLVGGRWRMAAHPLARLVAPLITAGWLVAFFVWPLVNDNTTLNTWYWVSEVWSRYMIGLPAAALVAAGLIGQKEDLKRDELHSQVRDLYGSACFFLIYGLTAGLIVPPQPFWPASFLNSETFADLLHIPVEVVRTVATMGTAFFTARLMSVFNVETARRLYQSEEERTIFQERERIARDLHDGMLQTLYGVGLGLRELQKRLPANAGELAPSLEGLTGQLGDAIVELRRAITKLREDTIPVADLVPSVRECAVQISRLSHLTVDFQHEGFAEGLGSTPVPSEFRDQVMALVREGLSNAVRHSGALHAGVMLALQDDTVILRITDQGRGFSPASFLNPRDEEHKSHRGLRNMTARAVQLGGNFRVESKPGRGTRLLFQIPLPTDVPEAGRTEGGAEA